MKVYWTLQFRHIKIDVKENESNENNLTLNQISLPFYILLCCLPFSISTLFIEIFHVKLKYENKINK